MAVNQIILDKPEQLYGRAAIPFQTLNFPVGTQQLTHSDTIHFHSFPQRFMAGVWVALEDITLENGPLHYYPGSHRLPVLDPPDVGVTEPAEGYSSGAYEIYEQSIQELIPITGLKKQVFTAQIR